MNKNKFIFLILLSFFSLTFSFKALAATTDNVYGWAWSENIGWISFNCTNQSSCATSPYGVHINDDGTFTGYAWSENIGWISFKEGDLTGCPQSPCKTQINLQDGKVSGWARALSYGSGWDGWIKMRGSNYGVDLNFNNNSFSGYAWGDTVVGWINFQGSTYKVETDFSPAPSISNISAAYSAPCSQSRIPTFSWETDASTPYDYQIRICSNLSCSNVLLTEEKLSSHGTSWVPACTYTCSISPYSAVNFNSSYYVQIRARNSGGLVWGDWESSSFQTNKNAYPFPDFSCDGGDCADVDIYEDVVVELSDSSIGYGSSLSCKWTLPDSAIIEEGSTSSCSVKVKFPAPPPGERRQVVSLKVTDNNNYSCTMSKNIDIRFPLPEYQEVPPIAWIINIFKNLFKKVNNIFVNF